MASSGAICASSSGSIGALKKTSPDGRTYQQRLDRLRTERELSELYEDMIREIPLGAQLAGGQNPVRTGGSTQVSIAFAADHMREKPYPWKPAGSAREEVFKRRGGLYFGAAMLLDYPVSYNRMLYRFADYNAGLYSSRNAAVQSLLVQLTGQRIDPDGDLLRYKGREPLSPRSDPSQAWRALLALQAELGVNAAQIERDLKLEKQFAFEQSVTYRRLYQLADKRGLKPAREQLPDIDLNSPKISRKLTTAWFADRCEARYRTCLARDIEVDVEVAMCNPVAHAAPRHGRVGLREVRMRVHDLGRCLAQDDQAHDDGLLRAPIGEKGGLVQSVDKGAGIRCGLRHVLEVVGQSGRAHTGRACASTCPRKDTGRSPGVRTSTGTPSRACSSSC